MAFGADFEPDTGNSGSIGINYHCPLIRRSCSKGRYVHHSEMARGVSRIVQAPRPKCKQPSRDRSTFQLGESADV